MKNQEELENLKREAETNPDNLVAVNRYEAALLRTDQKEVVKELYKFRYLCPLKWEDLSKKRNRKQERTLAESRRIRYCKECQQEVFYVKNREEFEARAKEGHCVAVLNENVELVLDILVEETGGKAKKGKIPPCMVKTEKEPSDFEIRMGMPINIPDEDFC